MVEGPRCAHALAVSSVALARPLLGMLRSLTIDQLITWYVVYRNISGTELKPWAVMQPGDSLGNRIPSDGPY